MRPKSREQQLAKDLFLHTEKTQQEIADILNINRKTIYLWIKQGRWEEFKITARQAPCMVLQDIWNHIDEINYKVSLREDRCPTPVEVDMLRKLLNMTKVIGKKHTGAYIEAFQELTMYIAKNDLPLAQKVGQLADKYIKGTIADKDLHFKETFRDNVRNIPPDDADPLPDPEPATPPATPSAPAGNAGMPQRSDEPTGQQQGDNGAMSGNDRAINLPSQNPPQPAPGNNYTREQTNINYPVTRKRENDKNKARPQKRIFRRI